MDNASDQLQELGFSQYEAQAYINLLQRNPLNGYELAKISGIPRPNVYAVLDKLQEKGAAVRLDTPGGTRYAPVPARELIQRLRGQYMSSLEAANRSLSEIPLPNQGHYVWNVRGKSVVIEHALAVIESAQEQLMIAAWPEEARVLEECLQKKEASGVQVSTLCLAGCSQECGACHGDVHRDLFGDREHSRRLIIVADQQEALAGEMDPASEVIAIRTRQKLMVDLAFGFIRNSIALSAYKQRNCSRLDEEVSPGKVEFLDQLDSESSQNDLLAHLRQIHYSS